MQNSVLICSNNFDNARTEIRRNKGKKIIFSSNKDELNRKILEKEKIDILLINQKARKDKLKQRDSGFNSILAKFSKKNDVAIGINLDEIINSSQKNKSEILARIRQNIRLCSKNKLKMKFICINKKNEKNIYDLKSLGLILGMPTWMAKVL